MSVQGGESRGKFDFICAHRPSPMFQRLKANWSRKGRGMQSVPMGQEMSLSLKSSRSSRNFGLVTRMLITSL